MANEKTWYSAVDYAAPDVLNLQRYARGILWSYKALLMGQVAGAVLGPAGAAPSGAFWTCIGSSDSTTAGMDNVDRWGSTYNNTKVYRTVAGSAHSWIALRSPAALGPYYLVLDYCGNVDYQVNFFISKTAPTGGSTTARPTATDEVGYGTTGNGVQFVDSYAVPSGARLHITIDANGNFGIYHSKNATNIMQGAFAFQTLKSIRIPGDTWPVVAWVTYSPSGAMKEGGTFSRTVTSDLRSRSWDGVTAGACAVALLDVQTSTSFMSDMAGPNPSDTSWDAQEMPVYFAVAPRKHLKGALIDHWAVSDAMAQGSRYPATGNVEKVCVGSTLVPLTAVPTL